MKLNSQQYSCMEYFSDSNSRNNIITGAAYAYVTDIIKNETDNETELGLFKSMLDENDVKALTNEEVDQAREIAKLIINNMTPVIYIDEMNPRP
ncbi:hypothetical protein [Vibrio rhizosphaerae]|uniref:hypothetical protein n=1 Tax=Vibrio rhizosphaerae TaxID=398736 RepID=UPI0012F77646|nr:hypothetical protein [Vibrio rhizosphaerae]